MTYGITFVGVGGQGTLLIASILSTGLVQMGYDVKVSEVHGMAQRGGSVVTQLRFGDRVYSPIMTNGESDVLVSFEKMEAARHLRLLKPGGLLIVNDTRIAPLSILAGAMEYPEGIEERLREKVRHVKVIHAQTIAQKLGNNKVQNTVILGVLIRALNLPDISWHAIFKRVLADPLVEINIRALNEGLAI